MSNAPVILITGASSGIGEATARLFGREGFRVVLAARRLHRLNNLADELRSKGGRALPVATDVAEPDEIDFLVQTALDEYGQIDLLLNNAGFGRLNWLEKLDPVKDIETQLRVNLLGVILTTQAVLPHMIERRSGHVINMVSVAGLIATPTYSVYAASKFAVRGFTEALRREVRVCGIHVSGIYPGGVETEFSQHTGAKRKTGMSTPAALRLTAEDVARTVLKVVRRPRRSVVIPGLMRPMVWVNTMLPGLIDWLIEKRFTRPE